ncbi:Tn3 family transposase [Enterococcus faecalis]|nr:Tn3 family transposase [Enterococcus faecalis]
MEEQLHSLGFTVNCIIYWNTLYIQEGIKQLKKEGMIITDEDIQRLSPLLTEHINFMGKYTFQHNEAVKNGELRPLYLDERQLLNVRVLKRRNFSYR